MSALKGRPEKDGANVSNNTINIVAEAAGCISATCRD